MTKMLPGLIDSILERKNLIVLILRMNFNCDIRHLAICIVWVREDEAVAVDERANVSHPQVLTAVALSVAAL
jgi:hypothetical protein